jgi:hypothetical protein
VPVQVCTFYFNFTFFMFTVLRKNRMELFSNYQC